MMGIFGRSCDAGRLTSTAGASDHYGLLQTAMETERPDLDRLAADIGIEVVDAAMDGRLCGWMHQTTDGWRIMRNAAHRPTRRRFTTAHMIGHHLMHRDLMRKGQPCEGTNDGLNYRSVAGAPYENPAIIPRYETQANQIAVKLIMPEAIVARLLDEGQNVFQIAGRLEVAVQAMAIRIRGIQEQR